MPRKKPTPVTTPQVVTAESTDRPEPATTRQSRAAELYDEARWSELESKIETIAEEMAFMDQRLSAQIRTAERKTTAATEAAKYAKDLLSGQTMERARKDAAEIHDAYRVAHLKLTVATESAFLARVRGRDPIAARNLALAAVRAFDLPASWWREREEYTLEAWMRTLVEISNHGVPYIPPDPDPETSEE